MMRSMDMDNDIVTFDYDAIERRLIELGASSNEAGKLTDILHVEGWGGDEDEGEDGNIPDDVLTDKIDWYRDCRADT